jgi:large subunit ribosomal protein L12
MTDEFVYAALLLHSAKHPITEENLIKVVSATGKQADHIKAKAFVASLEGINIEEAISKTAMPVAAAPVEKKEEKKEEDTAKKAEEAAGGLAALFG